MTEIELATISQQCLDRRIADLGTLRHEVLAWVGQRNHEGKTVRWYFS
jgi:hypothetical protein